MVLVLRIVVMALVPVADRRVQYAYRRILSYPVVSYGFRFVLSLDR